VLDLLSSLGEACRYSPDTVAGGLAVGRAPVWSAATPLCHCWLNRGVSAPEVAQRAGNSVDVLLKVFAKCIEGDHVKINNLVEDAFVE
jgi:hypothetical protein